MQSLTIDTSDGVATITLSRPDVHNAFDETMIEEITQVFQYVSVEPSIRFIVLRALGQNFSAGADLEWMRRASLAEESANRHDAMKLATMFETINACPKAVIGVVQGAALGGGVGLVACCDFVIASPKSRFCLSEVKLGLIPAVISPFVLAKIGLSQARRYMLSAEVFDADTALKIGLVHEISDDLDARLGAFLQGLRLNGPEAMADIKTLLLSLFGRPIDQDVLSSCADHIAKRRSSKEGKEGVSAFLEKRAPNWVKP